MIHSLWRYISRRRWFLFQLVIRRLFMGDRRSSAFTLIELLVVVAIISLLLAILLPSLNSAREQAKAVKCGANMRGCGQAVAQYLAESRGRFPVSYEYLDNDDNVTLDLAEWQGKYRHWSFSLFSDGQVKDEFFQCPGYQEKGGAPRTNPGLDRENWNVPEQIDANSQKNPNALEDFQATRMAYTANAAIMPRNKFNQELSAGSRINKIVRDNEVKSSADVIMVTEFNRNWRAVAINEGGGLLSKSHRPVNPFFHVSTGYNEYRTTTAGFRYGRTGDETYGLADLNTIENTPALIEGARGSELNAIGRHHPGGDELGGTTNFLFVDGHVERSTILKTMQERQWGDRYYSVTGDNTVYDRYGQLP